LLKSDKSPVKSNDSLSNADKSIIRFAHSSDNGDESTVRPDDLPVIGNGSTVRFDGSLGNAGECSVTLAQPLVSIDESPVRSAHSLLNGNG